MTPRSSHVDPEKTPEMALTSTDQTFILAAIEASKNDMIARVDAVNDKVDTGFTGMNARLDTLNGKTSKNTQDIVRIKTVFGIFGVGMTAVVGGLVKKYLG